MEHCGGYYMFRIKKTPGAIKTYTASLLPISLSIVGAIRHSPILIVLVPIALLISVALTPWARKRENIWMFLFVAVSGVPVNIIVIRWLLGLSFFETHFFVLAFFRSVALYLMLLSMEELILGVVTRMVWKNQYKISFSK